MRFYMKKECEQWLQDRQRKKPSRSDALFTERVQYPPEPHGVFFIAHWIAASLTHRMPTLLWISDWGVWPGSENWHLYYKLRQSYGDQQLLEEAPGHLFLEHEAEDLASFLQLAILNGWDGYVLTHADYVNVFFSHDEYIEFFANNDSNLVEIRDALQTAAKRSE